MIKIPFLNRPNVIPVLLLGFATAFGATDPHPFPPPGPAKVEPPIAPKSAGAPAAQPRILASDLFEATLAPTKATEVRMGSDYVLSSGDQLALTTFGSLALSRVLTVDRGGKVTVPELGIVEVRGLSLAAARAALRARLARGHAGVEQFNLEVVGLHDVQVFIIGEVVRAGSYLVPGASSAVTLLGLAGGPGPEGSWRRIEHLRAGRRIRSLDLYALRFEGTGLEGPGFQDGDCLFVPLAGRRIVAQGAFRRTPEPAGVTMELKDGERAADAVRFAGGLRPIASPVLLTVQRTSPGGLTSVTDLPNRAEALAAAPLFDGDLLRALPRRVGAEEYVEAAGAVQVPGRFAYRAGMRVRDLLSLKAPGDQVLPRAYLARGELLRTGADGATRLRVFDVAAALRGDADQNLLLQPRDRVELTDVESLRPPAQVTILGPLARPGSYPWHQGMRASDLLFRAGLPELRASRHEAELARFRDGAGGEPERLDLALLRTRETAAPAAGPADPVLEPNDRITVYEDPGFQLQPTVQITGQVRRPGPYVLPGHNATLKQLLDRAGGLTPEAMPSGGILLRSQAAPGEGVPESTSGVPVVNAILQRLNETRRAKESGVLEESPLLHGLLAGATQRLVVDFPALIGGDARRDVALQDGDRVHIPRRGDAVYVVGEVASPFASFHVRPGDRVRDVLKLAGGYTRNADTRQVRLLKASGRIIDSGVAGAGFEPGDALLVPQRIRKDVPWQDTLLAMTPLALIYNAIRH